MQTMVTSRQSTSRVITLIRTHTIQYLAKVTDKRLTPIATIQNHSNKSLHCQRTVWCNNTSPPQWCTHIAMDNRFHSNRGCAIGCKRSSSFKHLMITVCHKNLYSIITPSRLFKYRTVKDLYGIIREGKLGDCENGKIPLLPELATQYYCYLKGKLFPCTDEQLVNLVCNCFAAE